MMRPIAPPTLEEVVLSLLSEGEIARIDVLAQHQGVTREQMIDMLFHAGLAAYERDDEPPASGWRPRWSTA